MWQPLDLGLHHLHGFLGQCATCLVGGRHEGNNRMGPLPGHGRSTPEYRLNRLKQRAMPMVLQDTPTAVDRIVLAMGRRRRGQTHSHLLRLDTLDHARHALGAPTMRRWTILQIDRQCGERREPIADGLPPLREAIHKTITGHLRAHPVDTPCLRRWEEDAHGGHGRQRRTIVVGGLDLHTIFAPACEGADCDGRFGIQRDPSDIRRRIGGAMALGHLVADGVGGWDVFWGCLCATFLGE